jgi:branched-chain amino acid transport system ATP-binding protein
MLWLNNVHTFYGNIEAIKGITIEIREGEIVTLIGANGAGKSTTLMSIAGITPPRAGEIRFLDRNIAGMKPDEVANLGIALVPEGRRVFPSMSVMENLELGSYMRKDRDGIKRDIDYVFGLFPVLASRRHQSGGTLSGGEQQMLAISRGLMARPKLLLLDEPSLGLSPILVRTIFKTIKLINVENKTTIFLVEQNANLSLRIGMRGYVMENGVIKLADSTANLLVNEEVRKAYLGI